MAEIGSTVVPPAVLLQQLSVMFNFRCILILGAGFEDDQDAYYVHDALVASDLAVGTLSTPEHLLNESHQYLYHGIAVVPIRKNLVASLDLDSLSSDIVWILPQDTPREELELLATRLDSSVVTMQTENLPPKEWYRIRGGALLSAELEDASRFSSPWSRRRDLQGVELRVSTVPWRDFLARVEVDDPLSGRIRGGGLFFDILGALQRSLNFTTTVRVPEDRQWGKLKEGSDSEWMGIVGELQRQEVDVGVVLAVLTERARVVDFTIGFMEDVTTLNILSRTENQGRKCVFSDMSFLRFFTWQLWSALIGTFLATGLVFAVFGTTVARGWCMVCRNFTEGTSMLFFSILQQNLASDHGKIYRRIAKLSVTFLGFFIYLAYCSDLTAVMTAGENKKLPKSFGDVLEAELGVVIIEASASHVVMSRAKAGTPASEVYSLMQKHPEESFVDTADDQIDKVLASGGASLAYTSYLPFVGDDRFKSVIGFDEVIVFQLGFGLQKDSELRGLFDHELLKMREGGVINLMIREHLYENKPPDASDRIFVQEHARVSIHNIEVPGGLLIWGGILGILVGAGEYLRSCAALRRKKKCDNKKLLTPVQLSEFRSLKY